MSVTVSEQGRAILALCEQKEQLRKHAEECNQRTAHYLKVLKETSNMQKDILTKIAALDEAIEKIASSASNG
jgi:hypothetical protein